MNYVEPIRDRKKISQIKNLLRGKESYRDLLLFVVGINSQLKRWYFNPQSIPSDLDFFFWGALLGVLEEKFI
jgi:hypothetical protein